LSQAERVLTTFPPHQKDRHGTTLVRRVLPHGLCSQICTGPDTHLPRCRPRKLAATLTTSALTRRVAVTGCLAAGLTSGAAKLRTAMTVTPMSAVAPPAVDTLASQTRAAHTPVFDLADAVHMASASFAAYIKPANEKGYPYRDRWADGTVVYYQRERFVSDHFAALIEVDVKSLEGVSWPEVRSPHPAWRQS
jgi:hypothetical protein